MGIKQYHLIIKGRVQGVGYRYYTLQYAQESGLTGWVRNLPDGSVEIVAEGEEQKLKQLVSWVKNGPAYAKVDTVSFEEQTASGALTNFSIQ